MTVRAVTVKDWIDVAGLPLAVQVAAPRWHDHVVLAVAAHPRTPSWR